MLFLSGGFIEIREMTAVLLPNAAAAKKKKTNKQKNKPLTLTCIWIFINRFG